MRQKNSSDSSSSDNSPPAVQMSLPGLIAFSVSLVVATGLLTWFLVGRAHTPKAIAPLATDIEHGKSPKQIPPWGELVKYNIQLERPEEYAAFEFDNSSNRDWTFGGASLAQARQVMLNCGVPTNL